MAQANQARLVAGGRSRPAIVARHMMAVLWLLTLLGALGALPATAAQTEPDATTQLSTAISQTATIEFGQGILEGPLVVFYESDTAPDVAPGSYAGALLMGDEAGSLVVASCPALDIPPSLSAVCLAAEGLGNRTGVYTGTATVSQPAASTGDEDTEETAPGTVEVTVTVRRHWGLFVLIAVAGTLLSLWATWYIADYQKIRALRDECDKLPDDPIGCGDCTPGQTAAALMLDDATGLGAGKPCEGLQTNAGDLWIRSLVGERPDYDAITKALAEARNVRAQFCALCETHGVLSRDAEMVRAARLRMGSLTDPRLQTQLEKALATTSVKPATLDATLEAWGDLHALSARWLALAQHVIDLLAWNGQNRATSAGDDRPPLAEDVEQPDMAPEPLAALFRPPRSRQAAVYIDAARRKLIDALSAADLDTLRPDEDIRAAWRILSRHDQRGTAGQLMFATPQLLIDETPTGDLDLGSSLAGIGRWVRALVEGWSPAFNRGLIWLLFLLSLGVTIFAGSQLLYAGKPWGSAADMAFLFVVGTGVHAGLSGLAGAIATRKA